MGVKTRVWAALLILATMAPGYASAQSTVRLRRGVSPAAKEIPNASRAASAMPMEIRVRLALRNTAALEQLKLDQQDPSSPSYHKWLTPAQFNARFGATQADADAVAQWLSSEGFAIKGIDLEQHIVIASANAEVVAQALDTTIISNGTLFANTSDPAVPAALASVISNIEGLNNIAKAIPLSRGRFVPVPDSEIGDSSNVSPAFKGPLGLAFSPADFRTYYNINSLISGGNSGTKAPDCIALPEISDVHNGAIGVFTKKFALPPVKLTKVFASPGHNSRFNDAEVEADLDVEYSHTVSPATPIRLYVGSGVNDLEDAMARAVSDNACGTISISYGYCDVSASFFSITLDSIFSQAAAQGQTVFISSGDDGVSQPAACGFSPSPVVSEMCADPNVICVGGTQFDASYDAKGRNTSTIYSAPEVVWNDGLGATGGGVSAIFARPSWQTGASVPAGSMRLIPDVSLGASPEFPGYYIIFTERGRTAIGRFGGTSLSAPAWAGYSRLIANTASDPKLGNINPKIYELGNIGSSTGLIDVVIGNNSFHGVTGYPAGFGYDLSTGWGSPDMSLALVSFLSGGTAVATPASISDPPKSVITDAGTVTLTNTSATTMTVNSITVDIGRASIFKSINMTVGGQTVTPKKNARTVFNFSPAITIPTSGNATFTLGATMGSKALPGAPSSVQSLGTLAVNATVSGTGVTFQGLPATLGAITLTH